MAFLLPLFPCLLTYPKRGEKILTTKTIIEQSPFLVIDSLSIAPFLVIKEAKETQAQAKTGFLDPYFARVLQEFNAYLVRLMLILQDSCISNGYLTSCCKDLARWCVNLQDSYKMLVRYCTMADGSG